MFEEIAEYQNALFIVIIFNVCLVGLFLILRRKPYHA